MSGFLVPKNWSRFQHYRHRRPPWIKLHREMLDNYEFHRLPVASRALAPCLWLLAAEYENGRIPDHDESVAFRCHLSVEDYRKALKPLIDAMFFQRYHDASTMLATRKQLATSETETETETEGEGAAKAAPRPRKGKTALPADWTPSSDLAAHAVACGHDPEAITAKFVDYWRGEGRMKADWSATFRNWCRNEKGPVKAKTNGARKSIFSEFAS